MTQPETQAGRGRAGCAIGSEGVVWSAIQVALDRIVAVKAVSPDKKLNDAKFPDRARYRERRFYHEALITARLDHPNIVPIHDISRAEDGSPLIAMKLVKGEPWSRLLARDFAIQSPEAFLQRHLPTFISMMQAVAFAHSRGVVHRDLKPSQVMVGEFGEVVLLDWGIAVVIEDAEEEYRKGLGLQGPLINLPTAETAPNPAGTPALMAPEQTFDDARKISTKTDIYLLGGVLYNLLTGSFPHDAENSTISLCRASEGLIDPLEERAPEGRLLPPDLVQLCLKALQPNPEDRIDTVKDFIACVEDYLSGAGARRISTQLSDQVANRLRESGDIQLKIDVIEDGELDIAIVGENRDLDKIYRTLEECRRQLEEAVAAWGANPKIPALKDKVFGASAMVAAHEGALRVAQHLNNQVSNQRTRGKIQTVIEKAHQDRAAREKIRLALICAVGVLLAVIAGGSIRYSNQLAKERDTAALLRDEAFRQREISEIAFARADEEAYFAKINLADFAFREGNPNRVMQLLLETSDSKLRHWEWGNLIAKINNDAMTVARGESEATLLGGAWSSDGTRIYTGDRQGIIRVWEAETGGLIQTKQIHDDGVWDIVPSPTDDLILFTSFDNTASIVDSKTLEVRHRLVGHEALLRGGAFSPDGTRVITTGRDATARMWDVSTGEELFQLDGIDNQTYAPRFSADGSILAVTQRRLVSIHDGQSGELITTLPEHPENILAIAFSPDGRRLVTACTDRHARIFDVETTEELHVMNHETSWLHSIAWTPDGSTIITGGNDSSIRLWNADTGEAIKTIMAHPRIFHLRVSPSGTRIMSVTPRAIQVWNIDEIRSSEGVILMEDLETKEVQSDMAIRVMSSPIEMGTGWMGYDWAFRRTDDPGRLHFQHRDFTLAVDSYFTAIDPSKERAIHTDHLTLESVVEDFRSREKIADWAYEELFFAQWSPDGRHLGIITTCGIFAVHDGETLERRFLLGDPSPIDDITRARFVGGISFSSDSTRIATGRRDGSLHVWSANTGELQAEASHSNDAIFVVRFSPDGTLLAAGGLEMGVWNANTGEIVTPLRGHRDYIIDIAFHPDNRRILTADHDNQVKLWDTFSGREVSTPLDFPDERYVLAAGFSPSGREVYAVLSNGTVELTEAFDWTVMGSHRDILRAAELEKRQRRINPDTSIDDIDFAE